ncbi:Macrolide export ATP-binding/permease protein MacB [Nocardioides aquaticus]|uniref:Macrolide export ATP-binding/permease protein MacB n=1 Tax=Nocardioides aquaticus TaxID=160826 RepID=A0ABX8EHM0_9ACTN|nr:FtsX family ABC transporter permease [Nocardioides aquaticus]QVT78608.1 Macrolide export ATP-binding/permease protein MacB [Nocardioides aquaticus]
MLVASLKSLLGRKVRLVMSTFAIVLGVAFVVGSLVFSDTLDRSFTALFDATVGDVVVRPAGGGGTDGVPGTVTVPAGLVDELAALPGAARADGNVAAIGVYVVGADGKVVGGVGPPALGENFSDAPAAGGLEGLSIVEGRAPAAEGEVVLDTRTAEQAGYAVGDSVPLLTATATPRLEVELVGLSGFPGGGSLNGATLASFATPVAQDLFLQGEDAFSDVWVTAADGTSQEELAAQASAVLPDDVEAVTGERAADEAASGLLEAVSFLTTFLLIFAGIALVVGAFLIVNTFSILVAQRSRELALLRALGASQRQVTGSVLLEALLLGLLGSTLGLGLGVLLALGIRAVFSRVGLDLAGQGLVFEPRTVVAAYGVGVVVTLLAALLPALRTARIAPVQAMRDDVALPESSLRARFLGGVALAVVGAGVLAAGLFATVPRPGWWVGAGVLLVLLGVAAASPVLSRPLLLGARAAYARAFGSIGNLAGQNSLRNPRRTTATASALMIGLTLACTMAIIGDSAKASVDRAVEEGFVGDFVVSNVFAGAFSPSVADEMADVDGVAEVVRQRVVRAEVGGVGTQGVVGTDPGSLVTLEVDVVDGETDLARGTVLLEEGFAADERLGVGDELTVDVPAGERSWRVAGLFAENPIVFFPVLTSVATLDGAGFTPQDNLVVVDADDRLDAAGRDVVQSDLEAVVADQPIVTVKDQAAFAAEQREPVDQFVLLIFALLGLALLIAVLGIVNTLALSVLERTREIGLLRAIGVTRVQLRWMVTLESVVISLLGAVLGVVLGVVFGIALMYALREEGLEVISVPVGQLALFLALSVLVGMLAAVLPARRAARLDVLGAIATE